MSILLFLVFLSKILKMNYGMVRRRLRMLTETKICRSVTKLMLQPVLCLMVVSHLCLVSQYCTYYLTVNDPSLSHPGASGLTLPNDSDQDWEMDVSPPNNRSASMLVIHSSSDRSPLDSHLVKHLRGQEAFTHPCRVL